jgi:EAL domain-containing protein (putative c-di-GMP-specific phosphodiesterase class I)
MDSPAVLNLLQMIRIVWQPIAHATSRKVKGAEALARNVHDIKIPNLTDRSIALQCLRKAIEQAQHLKAKGLFTSVNIEPWMLNELVQSIGEPTGILLELTEREGMDSPDVFKDLQARGYQFMVDDWPQGHSREHLKALAHGGMVKISQEYFRSASSEDLIRDIADMHVLDMKVVAEGVETDAHWERAIQVGADFVQGFHPSLGYPMPLLELEKRFFPANLT